MARRQAPINYPQRNHRETDRMRDRREALTRRVAKIHAAQTRHRTHRVQVAGTPAAAGH